MPTALVCLCLLSTAFALPVPPPLPGTAAGNCVGQHRILLKGCNAKHGFYVFKYIYAFSTRNQTHIKKEEAGGRDALPSRGLGVDDARRGPTEKGAAPGQDGSTEVMEKGTGLKPQNHSSPGVGGAPHSPRPGTVPQAQGTAGTTGPSWEGSGDQNLVVEEDGSILPQGRGPAEAAAGNRSSTRSEDRDHGASRELPGAAATTAGRERLYPTRGAGDEGSGEATAPGRGQEAAVQGTRAGGAKLPSVTETVEAVQVEREGEGQYAYIPISGGVTVSRGKAGRTSFTQLPPAEDDDGDDDEVNILIGKANIRAGQQETTQPGATLGSKEEGSSRPLPGLGVSAAPEEEREAGTPGTAASLRHGHGVPSSPGHGRSTAGTEDAASPAGEEEGPAAPSPWSLPAGELTVPVGSAKRGDGDDEAGGEGQGVKGRLGGLAVTMPRQRGDDETLATVPAKGGSVHPSTTAADPQATEEDCTTSLGTAGGTGGTTNPAMPRSTVAGSRGSGEVRLATPKPRREGWLGAGLKGQEQGVGLGTTPRAGKVPSRAQERAGGSATEAGGSSLPRAGQAGGSATEAGGSSLPRAGQAGGSDTKAGSSSLPRAGQAGGSATKAGSSSLPRAGQAGGSDTKVGGSSLPRAGQAGGSDTKAGGSSLPRAGQAGGSATEAGGSSLPRAGQAEGSATKAGGSSLPRAGQAEGSATKAESSSLPRAGQAGGSATEKGSSSLPRAGQAGGSATEKGSSSLPRAGQAGGSATKAGGSSLPRAGQAGGSATKAGGSSLPRAGQAGGSATEAGGSSLPRAGQAGGSAAAGKGQERGQGGEARGAAAGAGDGSLPGRYGRRQGAGAPGSFSALSRNRQLEHLKRAAELHVRQRAFYSMGTEEAGPHAPHSSLASADSSRSSEGDPGSRSDSRQAEQQPAAWGAPAHPYGRWIQGSL
ncbi:ovocleidin-116-like [Melanerpes formicivorus]|uniref:ovocleidin-116-like n=1 Tax=Melanerpes formicivorus TaxID=211600 RepID=UPI00358F2280